MTYRNERLTTVALDALGVKPATYEPRATGHVPDMIELMKFGALPAFRKLKALKPIVNQLEVDMANEDDPETEQAIANAVAAVMKRRGLGE